MDQPSIFSSTLGLSRLWRITGIEVAEGHPRLDIYLDYSKSGALQCPACSGTAEVCVSINQTWYHCDFFNKEAYLHVTVPVVRCIPCGCNELPVPWSHPGSRFILLENEMAAACAACTQDGSSHLKIKLDSAPRTTTFGPI